MQRGSLPLAFQESLKRFESEIRDRPDGEINLTQAAALLALHADSELDVQDAVILPLASLARAFSEKVAQALPAEVPLPESMRPHAVSGLLCEFMAAEGFVGCTSTDYYRVENSLMNKVLARRTGIPITLSLVYQEVGRAA